METNVNTDKSWAIVVSWLFFTVFIVIGLLNLLLVHPVPGIFYLLFSLVYLPQLDRVLNKKFGLTVPFVVKIIIGLIVLWGTLAVGDLAEILGL